MLDHAGRATLAVAVWMGFWWMTEATHPTVTALLPLGAFPLLGVSGMREAAAPYAQELVFLFLGGFMLALALQRVRLDQAIALSVVGMAGRRMDRLLLALMAATAAVSMWVSNAATAAMMLPIALSLAASAERSPGTRSDEAKGFGAAAALGVAYAATLGGIATVLGTAPIVFAVSYLRDHVGRDIGFTTWAMFGLPTLLICLPLAWQLLCRSFGVRQSEVDISGLQRPRLGRRAWWVTGVFGLAVVGWVGRQWLSRLEVGGVQPLAGLSDAGVAMVAALLLLLVPVGADDASTREEASGPILDASAVREVPWDVLLLFGGGFSLAAALDTHNVGQLLGHMVAGLGTAPEWLVLAVVIALVLAVGEFASNTAATAALVPVLAAIAEPLGVDAAVLVVTATMASSLSFMLPVGTPPNALAYGTGRVPLSRMMRTGFVLDLLAACVLLVVATWLLPVVLT
jgi:sodium-dependent dicarboxylate transporter 2/3/5